MTVDDSTVDIHLIKLVDSAHDYLFLFLNNNKIDHLTDWLVDRLHCTKDCNERLIAIRLKIQQAILHIHEHDEIKRLLGSSCIN
ncbi:unnamed protein product [Rotaria sp. Silwood2]|nr:unnamed protein product [Rotaria sp. Silwood2]CAF4371649.1 unnamed protein product [Rotaria sp. Silwood2]